MLPHVERRRLHQRIVETSRRYPITSVLGARQTGKTKLVRPFASSPDHFFDLEDANDFVRLSDNALSVLGDLRGQVVIDEAQRLPDLFPTLRVLADRPDLPARFIITGSVSPALGQRISESLAGRNGKIEIGGLDLAEAGSEQWRTMWLRGSHPSSFLAPTDADASDWREQYLTDLIGTDLPAWSGVKLSQFEARKLLQIIADASARTWNDQEAAKTLQVPVKAIRGYVEALKGAYIIRELAPLIPNLRKRLRQQPTLVVKDAGILHSLLGIPDSRRLEAHSHKGHSWESFGVDQIIRLTETLDHQCFKYSVENAEEGDLVLERPDGRIGFEFKSADAPKLTKSMTAVVADLDLEALYVVHPGTKRRGMGDRIESVGIERIPELCASIRAKV